MSGYANTFSNATQGVVSENVQQLVATPEANTVAAYYGGEHRLVWSGNVHMTSGGWLTGSRAYVEATVGPGKNLDKIVTHISQTVIKGGASGGAVNTVLGYEAEIIEISPDISVILNFVGMCFPDLSALPNRNKIQSMWCYANNDHNAHMKNAGKYLNGILNEITPADHIGLNPGRYYSTYYAGALGTAVVTPNVIYAEDVFFPTRDVMVEVGVEVTVAHASNARFALFTALDGKLGTKIADFGEVSMNATGARTITVNQEVEAGRYFLCCNFQGTPTVRTHTVSAVFKNYLLGQASYNPGAVDQTTYYPYTYGPYPDAAAVISHSTTNTEPHLWFRVS